MAVLAKRLWHTPVEVADWGEAKDRAEEVEAGLGGVEVGGLREATGVVVAKGFVGVKVLVAVPAVEEVTSEEVLPAARNCCHNYHRLAKAHEQH